MKDISSHSDINSLQKLAGELLRDDVFRELLQDTPNVIMILDSARRVLYLNRNPVSAADAPDKNEIQQRPGECLGCINAPKGELGCSSSRFCRVCGFNAAITRSEKGKAAGSECNIPLNNGASLTLSVFTRPFDFNGERLIFCTLEDISEKKRREMLENIFLHDILNTASVLQGLSQVYAEIPQEKVRQMLGDVSNHIADEIQSYKLISNAETHTLQTNYTPVCLKSILTEVVHTIKGIQKFISRQVHVLYDEGSIVTERTLLRRVLINMLKNALEASGSKDEVNITGRYHAVSESVSISVKNPQVIPETDQLKLFQKSFSTKGGGRGWGTYSIKVLTEKYLKGKVSFRSEKGYGTTFSIEIPSLSL